MNSSSLRPVQTPILSLSGYTATDGSRPLENITTRAVSVPRFVS
jgi:hypothetical protein